jgi:hypothetical protein
MTGLCPVLAEDTQKITSLIKETQKLETNSEGFVVAWWITKQYWEESLKNSRLVIDTQKQELLKALQEYTVISVLDAKKAGTDGFSFTSAEDILKTATLTDPDGQTLSPVADSDLSPGAQNLFAIMKPLLANMLGRFGQNLVFVVFPGKDSGGKSVADPLGAGRLTFVENDHSFSWRLPLASLLQEKICPNCGEHLPGNYKFCPYDGTKLSD